MLRYNLLDDLWGSELLNQMHTLQENLNRLFGSFPFFESPSSSFPPVNIYTSEDKVLVTSEIPGVRPEDLNITVKDDVVLLKGSRTDELDKENIQVHRRERPCGDFSRCIKLPFRVNPEKVEASYHNGVLRVELSKHEAEQPRKIEVKTS